MPPDLGPAHVVLGIGANRLHDPSVRASLVGAAVRAATERGHEDVEVSECIDGAALRAAVSAAADGGAGLVIAIGGDGTVRETAGVLADRGIPLGIVPAGTGNLLAATLGISADQAQALETIARGVTRPIDIGEATWAEGDRDGAGPGSSAFVVACGTGLDARLVGSTSAAAKRRYGIGAYLAAAVQQATDLRPRQARLVVDGAVIETEAIVVLIANAGELVPGVFGPLLPLQPDDGLLNVFVIRGGPVGSVIGALELLAGGLGPTPTGQGLRLSGRSVEVEIDGQPPEPVQVDGDRVGLGRLEARIRPAAVPVLVPAGARPAVASPP